ncbi:MAG: hypothetical protein ABEI53_02200 [Candidatus Magasanikbacteria bacterium]
MSDGKGKNENNQLMPSRQLVSFLIGFVVTISVMNGLEIGASFLSLELLRGIFNFWTNNSLIFFFVVFFLAISLGSASAGYVAREESGKYGIIAVLPVVLGYHFLVVLNTLTPVLSFVALFIEFILVLTVGWHSSKFGARYGKKFKEIEDDEVCTFLNISWRRWVWFWVPLQFTIAQLLIFGYAVLLDLYAGWQFMLNPVLIQEQGWVFYLMFFSYFTLIPLGAAIYFLYLGFRALQLNRKEEWPKELFKFIVYFLLLPTIVNLVNLVLINYLEELLA